MGNRFYYCKSDIELGAVCYTQCKHCKKYYKSLEDEYKRIPRKLKKRKNEQKS